MTDPPALHALPDVGAPARDRHRQRSGCRGARFHHVRQRVRHDGLQLLPVHEPAPFDSEEGRRALWAAIDALPGVRLDERLTGRPWFSMEVLPEGDDLERFLRILEDAVDQMVRHFEARDGT